MWMIKVINKECPNRHHLANLIDCSLFEEETRCNKENCPRKIKKSKTGNWRRKNELN